MSLPASRRSGLGRDVWYAPALRLAYLRNAKVACSSIQKSLWLAIEPETFAGNPHARAVGPFNAAFRDAMRDPDRFASATVFSVVRNPFSRLLSAYLDKTGPAADKTVWKPLAARLGLDPRERPPLNDFMRRIVSDSDEESMDQHFRPQWSNLLHPHVRLDFVGHLERFSEVETFLACNGCKVESHAPHATHAAASLTAELDAEAVELIALYYRQDFHLYGYAQDPATRQPIRPVVPADADRRALAGEIARPRGLRAAR